MILVVGNIGRKVSAAVARGNIQRVRDGFDSNPLWLAQEIDEADSPDEHAIVSGTFSFTVTAPNTGKKIVVTDGRFDVKAR